MSTRPKKLRHLLFVLFLAVIAFLLVGVGMHTTQTAGLALATDLAPPEARPRVVALLYIMLLAGMLVNPFPGPSTTYISAAKITTTVRIALRNTNSLRRLRHSAVASTLVTNPVTFGPVYYGAYHLGEWVLGQEAADIPEALKPLETSPEVVDRTWGESLSHWFEEITTVGKPLAVGLVILACVFGVLVYGFVSLVWVFKTRWSRRQRIRERAAAKTKS